MMLYQKESCMMKNKNVNLVIADIDFTLVDRNKEIMPLTREMLKQLHNKGVLLGIASGRPCGEHLKSRYKEWGLDAQFDLIIGMNGGQIYDTRKDIFEEHYMLKKKYIKEIIKFMDPTDINCFVYQGEAGLVRWYDQRMQASAIRNKEPLILAKSDPDLWAKDNHKLLYRCKDEQEADLAVKIASKHPSPNYQYFKTAPIMVEFQDPRVNKGFALKKYCENNNISLSNVIAFGDAQNDNQMLELAGIGVCMLNGSDSTKRIADEITEYDADHDGVGHYLEKWFEEKES